MVVSHTFERGLGPSAVRVHCVKNVVGEINSGPTSTLYLLNIEKLLKCETLLIICYIQHSHRCLEGCIDIPRTLTKFCLLVRINYFYVIFPLQISKHQNVINRFYYIFCLWRDVTNIPATLFRCTV
jgi:hypothetical protein